MGITAAEAPHAEGEYQAPEAREEEEVRVWAAVARCEAAGVVRRKHNLPLQKIRKIVTHKKTIVDHAKRHVISPR